MKELLLNFLLISLVSFGFVIYGQSNKLEVFIQSTGGTVTETLDDGTVVMLDCSSDDAEQENDKMVALYDHDLDVGWDEDEQNVLTLGLRFRDIVIQRAAIIDSAFLIIHADEARSAEDVCILNITCEATDNAATFDEEKLITSRPRTTVSVRWEVAESWIIWQPYRSPDLSSVIQEIVKRSGWKAGNSLALIIEGENQGPSNFENSRE